MRGTLYAWPFGMRGLDPEGLDTETGILLGLKVSLHVCKGKMISLRYQILLTSALL